MASFKVESLSLKKLIPTGIPKTEDFEITETTETLEAGSGVVVKLHCVSADPYLRGGMKQEFGPITAFVSGVVVASGNDGWPVGTHVGGRLPVRSVQVVEDPVKSLWKLPEDAPLSWGVGILGMPGSTSYGGLIGVLRPLKGQTIFVSGAAGAVGSVVCQLAKNEFDCVVIGSAGGPEKCQLIKDKFGVAHSIDYKTCEDAAALEARIREVAPEGIDMYFDNVGGIHFDAAFATLRPQGRIALCGGISEYNAEAPAGNLIQPLRMIYTLQRIEGFLATPWLSGEHSEECRTKMTAWMKEGKLVAEETFFQGLSSWPAAFAALFTGGNKGKVVVVIE